HEDRMVIGRVRAPPTLPFLVRPGTALRAEQVAAHDGRADVRVGSDREVVVDALAAGFLAEQELVEEARGEGPVHEPQAVLAERSLEGLALRSAETIQRDGETTDDEFG